MDLNQILKYVILIGFFSFKHLGFNLFLAVQQMP